MPIHPPRTAYGEGKQAGYPYWRQGSDTIRSGGAVFAKLKWEGSGWTSRGGECPVRLVYNHADKDDKLAKYRQLVGVIYTYGYDDIVLIPGYADILPQYLLDFMAENRKARLETNHATTYWWNAICDDVQVSLAMFRFGDWATMMR